MARTILCTVSDDRFGRKDGMYGIVQDKIKYFIIEQLVQGYGYEFSGLLINDYKYDDIIALNSNYEHILKNSDCGINGRAYKPMAVLDSLEQINWNEYVIYNDCSPELWDFDKINLNEFDLSVIHNLCDKNNNILTAGVFWNDGTTTENIHTHRNFTLNRCMDKMGLRFYEDSFMHASGMICIKKTPETVRFVEEWLKWNLDPECASLGNPDIKGDSSYWNTESDIKLGHRHDQSISGLLLSSIGHKFIKTLSNDMNPYNFLQFCRPNIEYEFMDSLPQLNTGDIVENKQGTQMKVWGIRDNKYIVGALEQSCYATERHNLKLIK